MPPDSTGDNGHKLKQEVPADYEEKLLYLGVTEHSLPREAAEPPSLEVLHPSPGCDPVQSALGVSA